jgi:hypothetical protein
MSALVWKSDVFNRCDYEARRHTAVRGQYRIQPTDNGSFAVWHRIHCDVTGRFASTPLGDANNLEHAKAIAQAHADKYGWRDAMEARRLIGRARYDDLREQKGGLE